MNAIQRKCQTMMKTNFIKKFNEYQQSLKKNVIRKLTKEFFESMKYFVIRLEFTLDDYQKRKIRWNFHTYSRTILFTSLCWTTIIYLTCIRLFSIITYPVNVDYMKRLYNYDVGTVLSYGIICYSLLEIAWFQIFHDVITYDFQVNDLFIEYKDIDDDIINSKSQIFLQKLIFIADILTKTIRIGSLIAAMWMAIIMSLNMIFNLYPNGQINLFHIITTIPLIILCVWRFIYLIGQLTIFVKWLLIFIEFFILHNIEMMKDSMKIFSDKNICINQRIYWPMFKKNYVIFFDKTMKLNHTIRSMLMTLEMESKLSIIFFCLITKEQEQKEWFIYEPLMAMMTMFLATTGIYSRLASLSTIHQQFIRLIIEWQARTQQKILFRDRRRIYYNNRNMIHDLISQNLFIQTMADNHFGFTCSRIFEITKYKYVELLLLNIVLIIMFYKKFCLNLS
ncbi:hypothetical protein DERP_006880 [Dermatophagoides pteronyssinus]|uniref:Gustatory receptor n=1 Tax=Dermatophagoides pteronyssinus TaxID=6956 RepID=A0ABQ8ISA4_DERPT|nr:hypothetical protein DERP_006880 [Dermatophagoides pteronyssinus]